MGRREGDRERKGWMDGKRNRIGLVELARRESDDKFRVGRGRIKCLAYRNQRGYRI